MYQDLNKASSHSLNSLFFPTTDCNDGFANATEDNDLCQDIPAEIMLALTGDDRDNEAEVVARYEADLFQAILSGRLEAIMAEMFPDSPVLILTGKDDETDRGGSDKLSAGATAGIAIAALLVALVPISYFLVSRKRGSSEEKRDYEPYDHSEDNASHDIKSGRPPSVDSSLYTDAAVGDAAAIGVAANLGASQADYGKVSKSAFAAMEAGEDIVAEPGMDVAPDSSSNAGSSGWSSSAGISSMNTGSIGDSADVAAAAGIGLVAIGATSALSRKIDNDKRRYVHTVNLHVLNTLDRLSAEFSHTPIPFVLVQQCRGQRFGRRSGTFSRQS